MALNRKYRGSVLGFIGFMLSPLSWWNDAFVNLPLALGFGWLVGLIHRPAFEGGVLVGYWLTNVLGLVLLQKGVGEVVGSGAPHVYTGRAFRRDLLISLLYTAFIALLIQLKVIQPFADYFHKG